jgi:hypothetical protein
LELEFTTSGYVARIDNRTVSSGAVPKYDTPFAFLAASYYGKVRTECTINRLY